MNKDIEVKPWDVVEILETQEDIDAYLKVAFEGGDTQEISEALRDVERAKNMRLPF